MCIRDSRLGVQKYYQYFRQFGLMEKTGIDLPGEAGTIMHKMENMGNVELATVAFGQSFQITPIQLAATVSSLINGGNRVTPHFGVAVQSEDGNSVKELLYSSKTGIVSEDVSKKVRDIPVSYTHLTCSWENTTIQSMRRGV